MSEIRLGLVGCGPRGEAMLKLAVEGFEGIRPAAVCDRIPERLAKIAAQHPGAQRFEEFDEMLRAANLDALLVETPANCHVEFCSKALAHGVNVMGDVPCVDSLDEAQQLWDATQQSKALYMFGANPNMWGFVDAAADLKSKGMLGEPYHLEAEYIHDIQELFESSPWRATYESIKYCTHSLGPLLRLIDEDLEWGSCFDTGSHVNRQPGQHDAMTALFRTPSNVVVRLTVSFINQHPGCCHGYRVFGTRGVFVRPLGYSGAPKTIYNSLDLPTGKKFVDLPVDYLPPRYVGKAVAAGHGGADYALLDAFFSAIREGKPSPISAREGLRMTIPGIVAAESARRGGELLRIRYPWS